MSSHSVMTPPKKGSKSSKKKHVFSALLKSDSRVASAPRHVEVLHERAAPREGVYIVKVYAAVAGTAGSELMTVSWADKKRGLELELRYDERFPVSLRFKTQSDEQRIAHAREQIQAAGGYEKLDDVFRSLFPEFSV